MIFNISTPLSKQNMSKNYDKWERLVRVVLRREEFRELCILSSPSSNASPSSSYTSVSDMMVYHRELKTMVALEKKEAELKSASMDMDTESVDLVYQMSHILETGLDCHTLSILITLCEVDIYPESLASVVMELRKEPYATQEKPNPSLNTNKKCSLS